MYSYLFEKASHYEIIRVIITYLLLRISISISLQRKSTNIICIFLDPENFMMRTF